MVNQVQERGGLTATGSRSMKTPHHDWGFQAFENAALEALAQLRTRSRFRDVLGIGVAACVALACASKQAVLCS